MYNKIKIKFAKLMLPEDKFNFLMYQNKVSHTYELDFILFKFEFNSKWEYKK